MNQQQPTGVSRIDKLTMDRDGTDPAKSKAARAASVPGVLVGADVASSEHLQVALLTAVNLAHKSFSAPVPVSASAVTWAAKPLTALATHTTVREEVVALGGVVTETLSESAPVVLIGDSDRAGRSLRLTFDGWRVSVGPAATTPRLQERPYTPLAPIAAAAVAVGEAFSSWAQISVEATRKHVAFSLWRPDLPVDDPISLGEQLIEIPEKLEVFGLGHLGQAYVWALASLPLDKASFLLYLCDDDIVESPNLETGALLRSEDLPGRKTRVVSKWLKARDIGYRVLERFIDKDYRRCGTEPMVAIAAFDNNEARQWLANANFACLVDAGLGGEATNFDSISVKTWPQQATSPAELWPLETEDDRKKREERQARRAASNAAYTDIAPDDCGKILVANKAVAVPFVGAVAASLAVAELLRAANGGPVYSSARVRVCSQGDRALAAALVAERAAAWRGIKMAALRS
jgi:hypothetical protein